MSDTADPNSGSTNSMQTAAPDRHTDSAIDREIIIPGIGDQATREQISAALAKAIPSLAKEQRANGSWPGENLAGPQFSAQWLITKRHFNMLDATDEVNITRWIVKQQRPDGGFPSSFDSSESDPRTSAVVRFALGTNQDPDQMRRLDRYVQRQGGIGALDPLTQLFGCLAGQVEPRVLGRWTLITQLIPNIDRIMGRRFAAAINLTLVQLPCIVQSLQAGGPLGAGIHPIKRIEWRNCLRYLTAHQNPCGSFLGMLEFTLLGALAYEALGVPRSDPRLAKAIEYFDHFKLSESGWAHAQILPYVSEVWNSAAAVRTLLRVRALNERGAGIPMQLEPGTPGFDEGGVKEAGSVQDISANNDNHIHKGIAYLLSQQSNGVPADWLNLDSPTDGGWAYEDGNLLGSDCDTTAAVAQTLHMARTANLAIDVDQPIAKAINFLDAMQNESGGWPAFTHGLRAKSPGPMFLKPLAIARPTLWSALKMFLKPPLEYGDPGWADLTARIISAYSALGRSKEDPVVAKALKFMRDELGDQPAWWGRWEVNYTMASSYALTALCDSQYYSGQEWITDVRQWSERCQNADGGWGESINTYANPRLAGTGESTSGITSSVLMGLLSMGGIDSPPVQAGIEYLLNAQRADGTWDHQKSTGVMLPPHQFYANRFYTQCVCITALSLYYSRDVPEPPGAGGEPVLEVSAATH